MNRLIEWWKKGSIGLLESRDCWGVAAHPTKPCCFARYLCLTSYSSPVFTAPHMKKQLHLLACLFLTLPTFSFATSGGTTTRNVSINGGITDGATPGTNGADWETDEVGNSADGVDFYYTWDNTNLYVAWRGGNKDEQHILFLDTDPATPTSGGTGSLTGPEYGCQTPNLPFTANFFVNIQAGYNEYRNWNGTWPAGTAGAITVTSNGTNNDIEATIPWSLITGGRPQYIYLLSYLNAPCNGCSGGTTGFIYGVVPAAGGNTAGCNGTPAFVNWYYAQITDGQAPNGNPGVLPVELLAFRATTNGSAVELTWETTHERNSDHFEVLRSADLLDWSLLTSIPSRTANPHTRQAYSATDPQPLLGLNYYRLRQVDIDGQAVFSPAVQVRVGKPSLLSASPNPVSYGEAWLRLPDSTEEQCTLRLFDARGLLLHTWTVERDAQQGAFPLDLAGQPSGVYFVAAESGAWVRVVVQ